MIRRPPSHTRTVPPFPYTTLFRSKKLLAKIRGANLKPIRQMELDNVVGFFDEHVRQHAKPSEETQFDNAVRSARRAIELNDSSFENYLDDLRGKNFDILWRQRSEEHTSELQSLMRISYAVFCLKKKK